MSCERSTQGNGSKMPVTKSAYQGQYEGAMQTDNRCYAINGDNHKITDNKYYNNYYNRYNHYYITQRNYTTDYITDYNIYHYNKEDIYNGCYLLGSYDIVVHDQDEKRCSHCQR